MAKAPKLYLIIELYISVFTLTLNKENLDDPLLYLIKVLYCILCHTSYKHTVRYCIPSFGGVVTQGVW